MKKKVIGIAAGLILLAAAGGYAGVGHYYASHFFPKTAINGLNCAGLTAEQVKEEIQKHIVDYTLSITERSGKTETLSGTEIGLTYVDDHAVAKLLESQNTLAWPAFYWKEKENQVAADSVYDKEMVQEKLQTMEGFQEEQQEAPTDAYLTDDGTSYVIVPETEGEQVDYEKAEQAVIEALDAGAASVDLEEKDVYRKPGITQDDEALNGEMAELNHLTAARITYAIGENSYAIDRATLQSWLVQGEDGTCTISQDEAAAFVRHMAYETDTFGLAHTFKTSLGATINLNAGGDYGWCIDKEETTQALLQAIEDETQGNLDPVYLYTANDRSANDIGNTYVEVCISQQKMWCYKDGVLVTETPVTTGNHATGYDTPAGSVWAVDAKKSDCDFKLYPSHVMFWLPFNGDVGIHDASWRTEYGGDIYLTNGSHGCVNTPYTEAEKVFNAIEIGDPVIVYYSLDDVTGPQPTQKKKKKKKRLSITAEAHQIKEILIDENSSISWRNQHGTFGIHYIGNYGLQGTPREKPSGSSGRRFLRYRCEGEPGRCICRGGVRYRQSGRIYAQL